MPRIRTPSASGRLIARPATPTTPPGTPPSVGEAGREGDRSVGGAEGRRAAILDRLASAEAPIPGDLLAHDLGVSRQAIVHDVAVLRAAGQPIVATVRGYLLLRPREVDLARAVVAVRHAPTEAETELTALVDLGVRVVDVVVEHPVYGELRAELHIESRADVAAWAEATRRSGAHLLSELTDGVHLHTLEASSAARLEAARAALRRLGMLLADG
ncbi:MAG TPA: transcription repressor NadR [Candidatus Limnocylindrales bacterium]|nr:transcription repressor NadR [Candidatus Limnocylindrales bacterium]